MPSVYKWISIAINWKKVGYALTLQIYSIYKSSFVATQIPSTTIRDEEDPSSHVDFPPPSLSTRYRKQGNNISAIILKIKS